MYQASLKGCLKEVSRVSQRSFNDASSQGVQVRVKVISSNFNGGTCIFKRSSKGVSGKLQWCFKGISKKFPRSIKEVSRVFQESFMIAGCFKGVFSGV